MTYPELHSYQIEEPEFEPGLWGVPTFDRGQVSLILSSDRG